MGQGGGAMWGKARQSGVRWATQGEAGRGGARRAVWTSHFRTLVPVKGTVSNSQKFQKFAELMHFNVTRLILVDVVEGFLHFLTHVTC